VIGSGKHSSLLRYGNDYCRKKFYITGPKGSPWINTLSRIFVNYDRKKFYNIWPSVLSNMHQGVLVSALLLLTLLSFTRAGPSPLGLSKTRANHVPPEADLRRNRHKWVWPNSFYDIPKYRYPYYNEHGIGKLLYGFGGKDLYKYSVFRPIDGYLREQCL
jgi:hypothetical protein